MNAFAALGPINRPLSVIGWIITAAALAFMAHIFLAIDARSHSGADTLYAVYPFWGVTFLLWDWVARRLARR